MLTIGISTCPNDTFAFHGLLSGKVTIPDLEWRIELLDIQQLNEGLNSGRLDIAKGSFFSACRLAETHSILPVGAALGFGVGPIVVAGKPEQPDWESVRAMCPGVGTTASFLLQHFHPEIQYLKQGIFSSIPDAVRHGQVDIGVLIHEGRFTYQEMGLSLIEDLGERWEREYQLPLPLGGLFAKKNIPLEIVKRVTEGVRASLQYSCEHRDEALATMQQHAQEFSPDVLWQHVELYVNEETHQLSDEGRSAIQFMFRCAVDAGLVQGGEGGGGWFGDSGSPDF